MASEWDVIERKPLNAVPAATGGEWDVVERKPLAGAPQAKTPVGFMDAAARAARGMFASANQKAGMALTGLPSKGLQAAVNWATGEPGTAITDYQHRKFVAPWAQIAQESAIQPTEELTGPGIAGNVAGSVAGMVPEMFMGGPVRKGVDAGATILQNALERLWRQVPSGLNLGATSTVNRANQLQAAGVPEEVADKAALASYPTTALSFAFPLTAAGKAIPRTLLGGGANAALEIPAVQQENRVLQESGQGQHAQDPLDPANLATTAGIGSTLALLMGGRAPAPRMTREQGGYNVPEPPRVPDWAMQRYGDVLAANGITDPTDPRALNAVERLQQSEARKAEMRPGQGDTNVDQILDAVLSGEAHPNAAPWAGRTAEGPPARVQVDPAGNAIPMDAQGVPQRPGDVAGRDNQGAARERQIRGVYENAGLDPDAQLNAMRRQDLPPDDSQDVRSLKGDLDDEQKGLISHYMGVPADELAALGPNSQRRLLARAIEAQERDTGREGQGSFQSTFEGGDERASPASRPNVPGDRMGRSEQEDTNARLSQDQEAADLIALRERAAGGDKKAIGELRQREADAKKAAKQKTEAIGRLDAMRKQRDALQDSREYADLRRTRETGGTLTRAQEKTLDSFDKQSDRLGASIFKLESHIYDLSARADLASTAASGKGDRPFRGFSADEAEHAPMFEQQAREKASRAEQEQIDRLEREWRARQKIFEERARAKAEADARARAGQERQQRQQRESEPGPKQTGDGTAEAAPMREGLFETNEDGFVTSTNGNPVHFGHQRDAGWWILKKGNKQSANQVFEISNHPSGKGFTVRETHKTDPGPGPKGEPGGAKREEGSGGPKVGKFGKIFTGFYRNAAGAIKQLMEEKGGEAVGALHHKDVGDIDLVWGKPGTAAKDYEDGYGIAKLIAKGRQEILGDLQAIIDGMEITTRSPNRVKLESKDHGAVVRLDWDGERKTWLMTAYEKYEDRSGAGTRTDTASDTAGISPIPTPDKSIADNPPGSKTDAQPKAAPKPTGPSEKQRAYRAKLRQRGLARRIIDAGDTLMEAIIKMGGIHVSLRRDIIGDKGNKSIPFVGSLFTRNGTQDLSDLANQLGPGRWYFTQDEIDSVDGGAALLAERLRSEYDGWEPHRSFDDQEGIEAEAERAQRDRDWDMWMQARDDAEARGIPFDESKSLETVLNEYQARLDADLDALKADLVKAYDEVESLMGDRVEDIFTPSRGNDTEEWYRANIKALRDAAEEERGHIENARTRQIEPERPGDGDDFGGEEGSTGARNEEPGRGPEEAERGDAEGQVRDEFDLERQTREELEAREARQKASREKEEAEQRKADAAAKKAREEKEIADRQKSSAENFKLGESAEDSLSGQGDLLSGGKSDSGALYANPFHKALGWFLGDSRAWANSLSDLGRSIAELRDSVSATVRHNPLAAFVRAVFDSSSADMRAAISRTGSKTAQFVVDQFHDQAGSGRATAETYGNALAAKVSKSLVDLHRTLGDLMRDDGAMTQLARMLRSGTPPPAGTKLGDAARTLRKMLDDELKYLREAGVDVGEVKNGYFPREYVVDKIMKNGQGFIGAATRAYVESGLSRADAALAAKELHDSIVYGEHGNIFKSQGGSGQAPFLKGRTFGKQVDNPSHPLNQFLNHDVGEVLTNYFQRSAKRAEIARRFGDNFSHWRDYRDDKGRAQDGLLTRIEKEGGQEILTKLQDYIALAAGIRSYGISAGGIRATSIMRTWGALSFLEKATLSSLTEFIVPAMRSGNVLDAARTLSHTLNELFLKTKSAQDRRAIAEDLGLIAGHIDSSISAHRFAGGDPIGKLEAKILHKFFLRTGLTQWTDATRIAATDIGRVFIRRLALDANGKLNTRHLADLGIPADKAEAFSNFVKTRNDGMPDAGDLKGEMGDLYRIAVRKFVSQSIMNPSAVSKPSWMSHPIGAVVGQLQSFNYAFYENVIKRNVRLGKEAATAEGYTNLERAQMLAPMMISPLLIATAYAIGEARDALLGDPNRRETETQKEKWIKAASRGMPIAPLDPLVNFVSSAKYQRGAAQSFAGPVGGVAATGFDAARDVFMNNSEKTNTQERAAARATWDIFIEPAINLALFAAPVAPLSAVATQAAGSGHVREKVFVTPIAGPKHQKGDRAHGRTERVSPR